MPRLPWLKALLPAQPGATPLPSHLLWAIRVAAHGGAKGGFENHGGKGLFSASESQRSVSPTSLEPIPSLDGPFFSCVSQVTPGFPGG